MTTQLLTYSRLSTFRACPRRHLLRYELGIAAEQDSVALRVGSGFHAALEAVDLGKDIETTLAERGDLDSYDTAMVAAMVAVHQEHWAGTTLEVVATELAFDLPLINPDTGAPSKLWRMAGKIDRIYRLPSGILAVQDYKTTTDDITPGSDFWLRLQLDQQMSIYVLAARALGHDVQTILYDVTKRPLQRPLMATPADKVQLKKDGTPYANTRLQDETPHDFAIRIATVMREEPDRYFARHEIARLDADLDETRGEIWSQQLAMREAQRSGRWYRNTGACINPYHCSYLSVCGQKITSDPESVPPGFKVLPNVHPELTPATPAATEVGPAASSHESGQADSSQHAS